MFTIDLIEELNNLTRNFDNYFTGGNQEYFQNDQFPLTNVLEEDEQLKVYSLIPGVDPKKVDITYENGNLSITGEVKKDLDNAKEHIINERFFGKFHKKLKINVLVEPNKIKAIYKNGVLEIVLKKAEEIKPTNIKIN